MKRMTNLGLGLVILASVFMFSCKKQPVSPVQDQGQLELNLSISNLKSASFINTDTIKASTLTSVIVSIEDQNGKAIKNSEKVELYNMNGNYMSKPLSLPKGSYKLTRFLVLDWQNNVVYASPLKGSTKAYLVTNPLPLTFTVQTNIVTKVTPEVLNAAESKPEDFGYSTFSFNVAQTFDFLVGTFIYDDIIKNYKLTSSTMSIYTDTVSMYSGQLTVNPSNVLVNIYDSLGVTNRITLPERYNKYTLVISKPGYKTFSQIFTKEELKLYLRSVDKGPLVVILEKSPYVNGLIPILTTVAIADTSLTTATSGGNITSDGGSDITARGVCWSTSQNPTVANNKTTDGTGIGLFTSNIVELMPGTTYYLRAYAINNVGTGYGDAISFKTKNTVNDIDGNIYHMVTIGTQVWMLENLKTTHYRNGDNIPNVTDGYTWGNLTSGAYCNYGNDESNGPIYGRLYNGYAASDSRNIAPKGFHVPLQAEWLILINYLGGVSIAGGQLKEAGFEHWVNPNTNATNSSGFTALAGGYRHPNDGTGNGKMANLGLSAYFWTNDLYTIGIQYISGELTYRNTTLKPEGFSIRCIMD